MGVERSALSVKRRDRYRRSSDFSDPWEHIRPAGSSSDAIHESALCGLKELNGSFPRHRGEIIEERLERIVPFDVVEQGLYRSTSASEHGRTAHDFRVDANDFVHSMSLRLFGTRPHRCSSRRALQVLAAVAYLVQLGGEWLPAQSKAGLKAMPSAPLASYGGLLLRSGELFLFLPAAILSRDSLEDHRLVVVQIGKDAIACLEPAEQELLGERIFDVPLDRAS
ncbi:MAG: hypothetical protein QOJ65_2427 [Fimbriimonadaceae bacterium]|nr:hypothetical protein [Fimbriimonadaceae bacterium]